MLGASGRRCRALRLPRPTAATSPKTSTAQTSSGMQMEPSPFAFDIQPSAVGMPVGIAYDYDGTVTDALLCTGGGSSSHCFFNVAFCGMYNDSSSVTLQHALVVLSG